MQRSSWRAAVLVSLLSLTVLGAAHRADAGTAGRDRDRTAASTTTTTARPLTGKPADPGPDPPYEPGKGPGDLGTPWRPPTGPGQLGFPEPTPPPDPTGPDGAATPPSRVTPVGSGCVGGKFLDKSHLANAWLPGRGWTVELYIYEDGIGQTLLDDPTVEVDENGEWQYCIEGLKGLGKPFVYAYSTYNSNVELQDGRGWGGYGSPFWWSPQMDENKAKPPQGGIWPHAPNMDVYPQGLVLTTDYLDTGGFQGYPQDDDDAQANEFYALGDIMRWSTQFLDALEAHGIDPAPRGSHDIYYPADMSCGACFTGSSIYIPLVYKHIQRFTVQHELAHSLVDQHWFGSGIAAKGGKHEIDACTDPQLAYEEGIANFIAVWSHTPDDGQMPASEGGFNIETPEACPWEFDSTHVSEQAVAGAMWDLHDHRVDGKDITGAADPGGIVEMILGHPVTEAREFRDWYKSLQPNFADWIENVFLQNGISHNP